MATAGDLRALSAYTADLTHVFAVMPGIVDVNKATRATIRGNGYDRVPLPWIRCMDANGAVAGPFRVTDVMCSEDLNEYLITEITLPSAGYWRVHGTNDKNGSPDEAGWSKDCSTVNRIYAK